MDIKLPKLKSVKEVQSRKKKKIFLLSDDLRMSSGVGTMSREIVLGTVDKYDWVQIGGAIEHPDKGKVVDMHDAVKEEVGVEDGYLKVYPVNGYGNPEILKEIMEIEKPDAIIHYTDPRFWGWLYHMEHELRQNIPIFYYNIWDDLPAPHYNEFFYESCDLIMNISKQTVGLVDEVAKKKPRTDWDSTYVPHGINETQFYPIKDDAELLEMRKFKNELLGNRPHNFTLLYVNRNIRRKMVGDCILAFQHFVNSIPPKERDKVTYVMHTQPVDNNGTDLPALINAIAPEINVVFSDKKLDNKQMNFLYNIANVTMNIASNEGFGLGTCESLMSGTPIIVNVTGGLQDQCGFKHKSTKKYVTSEEYKEIGSLHNYREWEDKLTHGEWVKPVWPRVQTMVGSIPTPYIIDDKVDVEEVADAIKYWYDKTPEQRTKAGLKGRKEFIGEMGLSNINMCKTLVDGIETTFKNWKPKKKSNVYKLR